MIKKNSQTVDFGGRSLTLETGMMARQATGSVTVRYGETVVLVTVVGKTETMESHDFFPLTVNYQERYYASGRFPGGFFKREGRPSEREILISRLIDRPIRPLFPDGFTNEVQIVATVLSFDDEAESDIPALIGASAALALSGIPFDGPLAAARVGYQNGQYLLNPGIKQLADSQLDLVVAGTETTVLMVESEAKELPEDVMLQAVMFGHQQMQSVIKAIQALKAQAGKPVWDWVVPVENQSLKLALEQSIGNYLVAAYRIAEKQERYQRINKLREQALEQYTNEKEGITADTVNRYFKKLEKHIVRSRILNNEPRIDGRDLHTVRPITIELDVLPRTHGSVVFTRGETQALVVTTLGADRYAQVIDNIVGEQKDSFLLHYNFPPYSVGECGMLGSPKRREIGHGNLARRAINAILPETDGYPYTIRTVSEITESNGSSSMATVCGTSLSLMAAGVETKAAVSGIAMGLVKEGDDYAVLTDILGDEDHLGDMDFKVAGTAKGVTALQMDMKIDGITEAIMRKALSQSQEGRLHILSIMNEAISRPRPEFSSLVPRILTIKIAPDKIGDIIGKGGVVIRSITEETSTDIDISEQGLVKIYSPDEANAKAALKKIEELTTDVEVGKIYAGSVVKIMDFGAFIRVLPGKDGLVHISQIVEQRVNSVSDHLTEGQQVQVKVLEIDTHGKIKLTMRGVEQNVV